MKPGRFDIPFGSDFWMSLVLGLMFFITSLALLVSIGVNQHIHDWNTSVQATFTLELPPQIDNELPEAISVLRQHPEVDQVHVLDKTYVQKLMLQLGVSGADSPILVDFIVAKDMLPTFDADSILSDIQNVVPDAQLIKPALVSPEALIIAERVQTAAFGFGVIMVAALCLILAFLIHSEVQVHNRTISLFNLLGAPNYFISKIFQKYMTWTLFKAFFLSALLNCAFYYLLSNVANDEGFYMLRSFSPLIWGYVIFGVPILIMSLAQIIVPMTVMRSLKKLYYTSLHA